MNDVLNDVINLNPRINKEAKKSFRRNIFELKEEKGIELDKSKLFRAFVDKFNEDPEAMLKFVNLK